MNGQIDVLSAYGSAFASEEVFSWMIWDASTNTYHDANAVYDETYPDTDIFSIGGESGILDLITREIFMQQINLSAGWGLYSTFISPDDGSLETVLGGVIDDLVIMMSENGDIYWPELGINTIANLADGEGYQIKIGQDNLLEIEGDLIPSNFEMFMPAGWSYIAYLHQEAFGAESMMAPLADNLVILKDGAGSVYWPFIGVNALGGGSGMMMPGLGYQIKVANNTAFSYPSVEESGRFAINSTPIYPLTKFSKSTNTGSNMTIGIPLNAWETLPVEGDEIAAYSANGMLVGSVTYTGDATALTVWGDDITTDEVEGLLEGEAISFELWRKSDDRIEELKIHNWVEGGNSYSVNGIAIAGDISSVVSGLGYELYPNVPNPFGSVTSISFFTPNEGEVKIGIYDMLGNLVKELTNETYNPGMYMLEFRSEDVSAGTYFVRMTAQGFSVTNPINIGIIYVDISV